jgi:hypothetical protein
LIGGIKGILGTKDIPITKKIEEINKKIITSIEDKTLIAKYTSIADVEKALIENENALLIAISNNDLETHKTNANLMLEQSKSEMFIVRNIRPLIVFMFALGCLYPVLISMVEIIYFFKTDNFVSLISTNLDSIFSNFYWLSGSVILTFFGAKQIERNSISRGDKPKDSITKNLKGLFK